MVDKRKSLTEFAKANRQKPGIVAWLETIPEWEECCKGWDAGLSRTQVRLWLIEECGYSAEDATVSRMAHLSKNRTRGTGA